MDFGIDVEREIEPRMKHYNKGLSGNSPNSATQITMSPLLMETKCG